MWIFLWDTAPSKIFVGDNEVSKVFVWDTQVRPSGWWWQPWANTILYYSFNNTLNDGSWNNYNLTNSWTTFVTLNSDKKVLSVEQASATYTWWPNLVWESITVSFWFADTATRTWLSNRSYVHLVNDIVQVTHAWPKQNNRLYASVQWQNNYEQAPIYNDTNVWHHVVITFDDSTKQQKEYVDNSLKSTTTYSNWISGTISQIKIWWTGYAWEVHFKIGDVILEDKVWTDQEIEDYYNQTKADYWIS